MYSYFEDVLDCSTIILNRKTFGVGFVLNIYFLISGRPGVVYSDLVNVSPFHHLNPRP